MVFKIKILNGEIHFIGTQKADVYCFVKYFRLYHCLQSETHLQRKLKPQKALKHFIYTTAIKFLCRYTFKKFSIRRSYTTHAMNDFLIHFVN